MHESAPTSGLSGLGRVGTGALARPALSELGVTLCLSVSSVVSLFLIVWGRVSDPSTERSSAFLSVRRTGG